MVRDDPLPAAIATLTFAVLFVLAYVGGVAAIRRSRRRLARTTPPANLNSTVPVRLNNG
jgi:hypothetical protein